MFKINSIRKFNLFNIFLLILVVTVSLGGFALSQYQQYIKDVADFEFRYIESKKIAIRQEVEKVMEDVTYRKQVTARTSQSSLSSSKLYLRTISSD